ncbi:PTS sugar transporter subunit IIB [uncultured Anaerococcus sp.]|uniref:PTS sugar transporter subunit IIB n=1 Tax=uncultured Anaerococcus sp. TaxID=293428 RepID=UPI002889BB69|nr:PTS sugar transporter subunit IIB [uncultured Anaerococcus sp.]
MKKILVVCGNGIASSSIMVSVIEDYLHENGLDANINKASLMDCDDDFFNSFDLVVSSTKLSDFNINKPVIIGAGLLTGINDQEILEEIGKVVNE